MHRIVTALAVGLASGFSSYERKEGCPELYWRGVLDLDFNPAFLHVDEYASGHRSSASRTGPSAAPSAARRRARPEALDAPNKLAIRELEF